MVDEIIYIIKIIIICFICFQWSSVLLFFAAEWVIVDYYKWGVYENPETKFQKVMNFIMNMFLGSGYYFYNRFQKYNWITRKFFMLIALLLQGILSITVYLFYRFLNGLLG
ncbi:hypothetical protein [Pseudalkalibacillus decolorationis]|uniref:hypothetical protein n=1 Tax=Pseudalkalibacillus decolorationis TaxID=163879 RepID=UPI0021474840|nr:hypothetical protein [Pseudalkalibacillus decolorationis]